MPVSSVKIAPDRHEKSVLLREVRKESAFLIRMRRVECLDAFETFLLQPPDQRFVILSAHASRMCQHSLAACVSDQSDGICGGDAVARDLPRAAVTDQLTECLRDIRDLAFFHECLRDMRSADDTVACDLLNAALLDIIAVLCKRLDDARCTVQAVLRKGIKHISQILVVDIESVAEDMQLMRMLCVHLDAARHAQPELSGSFQKFPLTVDGIVVRQCGMCYP